MSTTIDTADDFFGIAAACPIEDVELDGGRVVHVRGLTVAERDAFETSIANRQQAQKKARKAGKQVPPDIPFRASMVALCVVNAGGERVFDPRRHIQRIAEMPAEVVSPIVDAAIRLSGMRPEDVDDLEGNSDGTDDDGSSSSSHLPSDGPSGN